MLLHFSFKDPATTEIYTLSLHDALPILHRSDLLSAIQVTNKRSQNFYAESLAKHLGALRCGQGSWEDGVRAIGEFATGLGIPQGSFKMADGSGMSRENRFAPRHLT